MTNLILPSCRIMQPQDTAIIDWANPLSSGLVFDVDGTSTLEKVSGVFGSSVGSTKSVDASIGHQFVRASSQYINYGDLSSFDLGTSPFSFEFLVKLNSSASGSTRMQVLSKDSASGRQIWTEFNTRGDGTTNDSTALVWLNGSTLSHKRSPVGSTPANTLLHIVTQFTGAAVEFYINGVSVSVTTEPGGANLPAVAATSTSVYLGARAYSGYNDYLDGNIYIARLRNRALSAREVLELYANPWQVYEKQNRVLYFDAGGGGLNLSQTSRFDNSNSFYAHTVITDAVTLTADLFSNSNIFYAHTVTQGGITQTIAQSSSFQNSNSFYAPTVTPGSVSLVAGLFTNSNSFYTHTVSQEGLQSLTQSDRFDNTSSFYSAVVGSGSSLTPEEIAAIIAALNSAIDAAINAKVSTMGLGGGAGYPVYEKPKPKKKSIYELLDMGVEQQYKEITKTVEVVKSDKKQAKKVSKIIEPFVNDEILDIESLAKEKLIVTQLLNLHNEIIAKEVEQQAIEYEKKLILQQQENELIRQNQVNAVFAVIEYEENLVINALRNMIIGVEIAEI